MSTKTEDKSSVQFDPQSMKRYQGWQGAAMPWLQQMFTNPFGSSMFQQNLGQNMQASNRMGGNLMRNAFANFGLPNTAQGTSGAKNALMAQLGRYGTNLNFQGFSNAINSAQQNMWNAGGLGSSLFQPLQTGQTNVQTKSGLGTWLPQLAAMGISAATMGMGSPLMGMAGGLPGMSSLPGMPTSIPFGSGFSQLAPQGGAFNPFTAGMPVGF